MVEIAASIMIADFCHLAGELKDLEEAGADWIHWDVMDGNFVPNLTFGAWIINSAREASGLPFDVHLMVTDPELIISQLTLREGDLVVEHVEAVTDPRADLLTIREKGWRGGLAISPATPIQGALDEAWMSLLDVVVVMGVQPGFAGQTFIEETLEKVRSVRRQLNSRGKDTLVEVDGGVNVTNAPKLIDRGANILVAGKSIFKAGVPYEQAIASLRGSASR